MEEANEEYSEEVAALASGEESLSEGFKKKAATIFEAAVSAKVVEEKKSLEESFEAKLNEEVAEIRDELVEKIDSYLSNVAEEWVKENEVAVDAGLRNEVSEDFMKALKNLFTEHYIEVPESKIDVVSEAEEKINSLEEQVSDLQVRQYELVEELSGLTREKIIAEAAKELASTDAAKFNSLIEGVEFVDVETFKGKVKTIKESFFASEEDTLEEDTNTVIVESSKKTVIEGETDPTKELNPTMRKYNEVLSRTLKY